MGIYRDMDCMKTDENLIHDTHVLREGPGPFAPRCHYDPENDSSDKQHSGDVLHLSWMGFFLWI